MLQTPNNPEGTPLSVFDGLRAASLADRSKLYRDLASGPFFGFNRPNAQISQGMIDAFWLQGMQAGHKNANVIASQSSSHPGSSRRSATRDYSSCLSTTVGSAPSATKR